MTSLVARRTSRPHRSGTGRLPGAPLLVLPSLLLLALAGCGSPAKGPDVASAVSGSPSASGSQSGSQSGSPSGSSGQGKQGDVTKFAECMRKYGIDVQVQNDGGGGAKIRVKAGKAGDKGDAAAMDKAQRECRQFAPGGGPGADSRPIPKEEQAKFLAFARCMREHGVPMQDPSFEGGGVRMGMGAGPGQGPQPDDASVEAAQKACQSLLPDGMPGGKAAPALGGGA